MKIDRLNIDGLKEAEYNPRKDLKPGDAEYEKLKKSIAHFGYVEPVIINDRTGLVVGGHQRLKVLKDLGYSEIEVVHVDLDEENERALNIALNKISGDWDTEKLEDLLSDLVSDADLDIELTGFDTSELNSLLGSLGDEFNLNPDELSDEFKLESSDRKELGKMTLILHNRQIEILKAAADYVIENGLISETFGNKDKVGNAIYEVVRQWVELKTLHLK